MSFPKDISNEAGKAKKFGNVIPADERSNAGPTTSSKTIGNIKGRLSFSKQNISSLNTGEPGVSASVKTTIPGRG